VVCASEEKVPGSIAEGYVADECLTFCSRYLGVFIRLDRPKCNSNSLADMQTSYLHGTAGSILGKVEVVKLDVTSLNQAHRYVLRHCDEIEPAVSLSNLSVSQLK
jgi:hypothetical protein